VQLLQLLKLSKEKWEEARDHAMRAVIADNRVRAWFADRRQMNVGLLYPCRLGVVDLDRPLGECLKMGADRCRCAHWVLEFVLQHFDF
jgi:hypothetical protein